jgi:hypothetical protein
LLAGPYLIATILVALICNGVGKGAAFIFTALSQTHYPTLDYQLAKYLFFISASIMWIHYLQMALSSFWAAVGSRMTVLQVTQLVAVTVLIFAVAHYYVALFSDGISYKNVRYPQPDAAGWGYEGDFDDRLFFWPDLETVVDFIYFSAVTTATVGYGDIYPVSMLAKLLTVVQIGTSFILVVVVLGWVIGKAQALGAASTAKDE